MRRIRNIIICVLAGVAISLQMAYAKSPKGTQTTDTQHKEACQSGLSVEQEQQFLYYFYEAQRLIQTEELDKAWEVVQFCQELNPNNATVNNYMGCFLEAMHREQDALPYFRRAYQLAPDEYWYRYALMLLQTEQKPQQKEAIRLMEGVAAHNKQDADVREMLQKAYIVTGAYKKALAMQEQLDSINGYDAISAMQRYRLNVLMHNNKQAIAEIERYLDLDPDNRQFQVFRLQLYEQTRQPAAKMAEAYAAVLRLEPRNLMLMNNLAWSLCISGGDLDRAEQLSRVTIMNDPSNPIYLDTYAWIMYHQGDNETAWFYIQRAKEHADSATDKEIRSHYRAIQKKQKK